MSVSASPKATVLLKKAGVGGSLSVNVALGSWQGSVSTI